jgi:hypothetical protein
MPETEFFVHGTVNNRLDVSQLRLSKHSTTNEQQENGELTPQAASESNTAI